MSASTRALRDFAQTELPALLDLWAAAWTATGIPIDFDARRAWIDERPRALRAGAEIVVGLDANEKAAGFVRIDPRSGALEQLCVAPAERGSGLAIALIDEARRRSPGAVELQVNEANPRPAFLRARRILGLPARDEPAFGTAALKMRWRASG